MYMHRVQRACMSLELGLVLLMLITVHTKSESDVYSLNIMDCTSTHVTIDSCDSMTGYHVRFDE
jgi:hypothetical protein